MYLKRKDLLFTCIGIVLYVLYSHYVIITYSVLKEVRIQILVESILIFDITLLPIDFIAKRYTRALYQLHSVVAGQINIHYLLAIVSDVKPFMRPDIVRI